MGNKNSISKNRFVELQDFGMELDNKILNKDDICGQSNRCCYEPHIIDMFSCRLRIVRCTTHGEIYPDSMYHWWK